MKISEVVAMAKADKSEARVVRRDKQILAQQPVSSERTQSLKEQIAELTDDLNARTPMMIHNMGQALREDNQRRDTPAYRAQMRYINYGTPIPDKYRK